MKIKLTPSPEVFVEIDGIPINGPFKIESEWNGLLKLTSTAPVRTIIIRKPKLAMNPYDYVPTLFGGGQAPEKLKSVDTEVVSADFKISKLF